MKTLILAMSLLLGSGSLALSGMTHNSHGHGHNHAPKIGQPYAGQQERSIKSLSADDIAELQKGGGWGMAKAAELNGVPGPLHLLEMSAQIPLTPSQITQIEQAYDRMKSKAQRQGRMLIDLERELDDMFKAGNVNEADLQNILRDIGEARAKLRFIHLSAHLGTPNILSADQITRYNELRGYGVQNRCDDVPEGHDAARWRKHLGCAPQ